MPTEFYTEVVFSNLVKEGNGLVLLSTLKDEYNVFSLIENAKGDDGVPIFRVVSLSMVCNHCRAVFETTRDKKVLAKCTHMDPFRAHFQSEKAYRKVKALNTAVAEGDDSAYLRENLNVQITGQDAVFEPEAVVSFLKRPAVKLPFPPPRIYLGIDPCEGGARSRFAMCAIAYIANVTYILALANVKTGDINVQHPMILDFVRKLATGCEKALGRPKIVVVPERNGQTDGQNYRDYLEKNGMAGYISMFHETKSGTGKKVSVEERPGFRTTAAVKRMNGLRKAFKTGRVCVWEGLLERGDENSSRPLRTVLADQLNRYSRTPKFSPSSKQGLLNDDDWIYGTKDKGPNDLVMALSLAWNGLHSDISAV